MSYLTEIIEIEEVRKIPFKNKKQEYKIVYFIKSKNGTIYQYQSIDLEENGIDIDIEILEFAQKGDSFKVVVLEKRSKLYRNKKIKKIMKILLDEDDNNDILKDFLSEE